MARSEEAAKFALERFGLMNQTAIVTGGSRGIGNAVVTELCSLGAKVHHINNMSDIMSRS